VGALPHSMGILERERTSTEVVMYALYLYFLGLSFRATARAIEPFAARSYVAVWYWVQKFSPEQFYQCRRVSAYLIDETQIQIGNSEAWLWVAVEPVHRAVLGVYISRHRNILVAESNHLSGRLSSCMVDIQYTQMVIHGIQKHVINWAWNIGCTHRMRRALLKER